MSPIRGLALTPMRAWKDTHSKHHNDEVLLLDVDLSNRLSVIENLAWREIGFSFELALDHDEASEREFVLTRIDELADGLAESVDLGLDLADLRHFDRNKLDVGRTDVHQGAKRDEPSRCPRLRR